MLFKNYLNRVSKSNRIYTKPEIREMKLKDFFKQKKEFVAQYQDIGLPKLDDLKNSPNVVYVEDPNEVFGGRWESVLPGGTITGGAAPVDVKGGNGVSSNSADAGRITGAAVPVELNGKRGNIIYNANAQERIQEGVHNATKIINEAKALKKEIVDSKNAFRELLLTEKRNSGNIVVQENSRDALGQLSETVSDFIRNYNEMKDANFIGADKYFHSKANCEGAQRGEFGELAAKIIGDLRELTDLFRNSLEKQYDFKTTIEDKEADLEANRYGRVQGRKYPNQNSKELVDKYRPAKLPLNY